MLKEERRQRIVRILEAERSAKVSDLARQLSTSRATIWRDIDEMAAQGRVTKVHGGATLALGNELAVGSEHGLEVGPLRPGLRIGMQVPDANYYYPPVIAGVQRACDLAGASLLVMRSGYPVGGVDEAVAILLDSDVDGLLLSPTQRGENLDIPETGRPFVLVEREKLGVESRGVRSVSTAHEEGVHTAISHLQGLGHRRIALVARSAKGAPMRRVVEGWRTAAQRLLVGPDDYGLEWVGDDAAAAMEQLRANEITAALCMNDVVAAQVLRETRRCGLTVPRDLSLIAYDDELAKNLKPALTAVSPDREAVGFVAAQQLLTLLSNTHPGPDRRIRIDPRLVIRDSTCPPDDQESTAGLDVVTE